MNEQEVFAFLKKQKKAVLLEYLQAAFDEMNAEQRRNVFGGAILPPARPSLDGEELQEEIDQFRRDSLARNYYKPFNKNSKNFQHIPEATRDWCDRFAGFVEDVAALTARGDHAQAVACFAMLYELTEAIAQGKEIIFAEEVGPWLIPTEEKVWLKAYLTSLAATATPEAFTTAAIPIIKRDSFNSFAARVYTSALEVANPQQKAQLRAEVQRQKIRTSMKS